MRKYEIMFIVRPDLEEAKINATQKEFETNLKNQKIKVLDSKVWGQKGLAYTIDKHKNGYYFVYQVEASIDANKEIDRLIRINENIIRHLIISLDN